MRVRTALILTSAVLLWGSLPASTTWAAERLPGTGQPVPVEADSTGERLCPACRGEPTFQATLSVTGMLVEGALGLPGEPVIWAISVSNMGTAPGHDLLITLTAPSELRIEDADNAHGAVTVSDRAGVFTVPELYPGQTARVLVRTRVLRSPPNGVLVMQAVLAGQGPSGTFSQSAVGELFTPTGLPSTGYPPGEALPGDGEPSVVAVALGALAVVIGAALYVWYRGRRMLI